MHKVLVLSFCGFAALQAAAYAQRPCSPPPSPPSSVNAAQTGPGTVQISWGSVAVAFQYNVYREVGGVQTLIGSSPTPTTSFVDSVAPQCTAATYTVTSVRRGFFPGEPPEEPVPIDCESIQSSPAAVFVEAVGATHTVGDYVGDGRTDIAVVRPSTFTWYVLDRTNPLAFTGVPWGTAGDRSVPGDYDGDGITDDAVFRPSDRTWYLLRSCGLRVRYATFGLSDDVPVPRDYDGDGKTDLAVYRPSDNTLYYESSATGSVAALGPFGYATDLLVPGDYDDDGKADLALYRPNDPSGQATWYVLQSATLTVRAEVWGQVGDRPVPADYTGDGRTDFAVYRPATGTWYVLNAASGTSTATNWGLSTDVAVPGDYDKDGKADLAVFRPSSGAWYILRSSNGAIASHSFGLSTDLPVPALYLPN